LPEQRQHLLLEKEQSMNLRSIVAAVFLPTIIPVAAAAQSPQKVSSKTKFEPPALESSLAVPSRSTDAVISSLLAVNPEIPLGPSDVLKGYEAGMTAIAERVSAELASISQAVRLGHITPDQAEYLTQQRYQLAAMQYQVLETLHDSLAYEMTQASARSHAPPGNNAGTILAVQPPLGVEGRSR
jgi:hypothetical protein